MARPVNILVALPETPRSPAFAVTFRQRDGRELSWLLGTEEAADLAVQLTGALVGQAVAKGA